MAHDKQLKVGLITALVFALFFAVMLGYFIAVKNLWMCVSNALMLSASISRSIKLYRKIKE